MKNFFFLVAANILFLIGAFGHGGEDHSSNNNINTDGTGIVNGYYIGPGVDLNYANFNGADLSGANLTGANLSYCQLVLTNLTDVNFTGANLSGALFIGANLYHANLNHTNIQGTNFSGSNLDGISVDGLISINVGDSIVQVSVAYNPRFVMYESLDMVNWVPVNGTNEEGLFTLNENIISDKFYKIIVN